MRYRPDRVTDACGLDQLERHRSSGHNDPQAHVAVYRRLCVTQAAELEPNAPPRPTGHHWIALGCDSNIPHDARVRSRFACLLRRTLAISAA